MELSLMTREILLTKGNVSHLQDMLGFERALNHWEELVRSFAPSGKVQCKVAETEKPYHCGSLMSKIQSIMNFRSI